MDLVNEVKPYSGFVSGPGPSRTANPLGGESLSADFTAVFASVVDLLKGVFTSPETNLVRESSRDAATGTSSRDTTGKSSDSSPGLSGDLNSNDGEDVRKDRTGDEGPLRRIQEEVRRAADRLVRGESKTSGKTVRQMVAKVEDAKSETPLPLRIAADPAVEVSKSLPHSGTNSGNPGQNPQTLAGQAPTSPGTELPVVTAPPAPEVSPAVAKEGSTDAPPPPPAPAAPSRVLSPAQMTLVEVPVKEAVPVRTEGGNRGLSVGEARKTDGISSAARAARSRPAPPDTQRVEFVERLMKAARVTRFRGQSRLRMILSPPRLGSVKVDLVMKDKVMHGKLITESVAAREAVQSQLQSLKEQLQSQGIEVGELEVGVDSGSDRARPDEDAKPGRLTGTGKEGSSDSSRAETASEAEPAPRSPDNRMIDLVA